MRDNGCHCYGSSRLFVKVDVTPLFVGTNVPESLFLIAFHQCGGVS
jgi:hypothetical protein